MDQIRDHASSAPEFNTDSIQFPEVAEQGWSHHVPHQDQKAATASVSPYDSSPFLEPDEQEKIARPATRSPAGRRVAGLPAWAFWLVFGVASLIVIGASVGGAVGGSAAMRTHNSSGSVSSSLAVAATVSSTSTTTTSSSSAPSSTSTTTSSSSSAPSSTITTGCPGINGTEYTGIPGAAGGTSSDTFIKMCGGTNVRWVKVDNQLMSAYVPSLEACIQMCSNWNFWHASDGFPKCITAALISDGEPPNNCWITSDTVQVENYNLVIGSLVQ